MNTRNGKWTYEQIVKHAADLEKETEEIYKEKKYVVPNKPPVNILNDLCVQWHERAHI